MVRRYPEYTSVPYCLAQTSVFATLTYLLVFRRSSNRFMNLLMASGMGMCAIVSLDTTLDVIRAKQTEEPKESTS